MLRLRHAFLLLMILPTAFCAKKESDSQPAASTASVTTQAATTAPSATSAPAAPAASPGTVAAAPAPEGGIATAEGETPGITATIRELKRSSGGIVSLKFTINNGSDKQLGVGYNYGDSDHDVGDFASIAGVQLIDPVGKKKYFVARDSDGKCICSRGLKDIAAGASLNVWAKFPAPPDDVQKIGIVIPHFSPLDDVPIGH